MTQNHFNNYTMNKKLYNILISLITGMSLFVIALIMVGLIKLCPTASLAVISFLALFFVGWGIADVEGWLK